MLPAARLAQKKFALEEGKFLEKAGTARLSVRAKARIEKTSKNLVSPTDAQSEILAASPTLCRFDVVIF